jgi:hypothetical protein
MAFVSKGISKREQLRQGRIPFISRRAEGKQSSAEAEALLSNLVEQN